MIRFDCIKFRNFLSYGNNWTTYDFHEGEITRVRGENGQGKSTCVVDTLYYACFGRPYRKQRLEQLINWINKKELEVHIWFCSKSRRYRIERGMRPEYFYIYEGPKGCTDDEMELIPVPSSTRNYQKILEEDILHMNEGVFNQTVVKSMTKQLSFMTLSKYDKRQVVEAIFGMEIFTHMNELAHQKLLDTKTEIDLFQERVQGIRNLIESEVNSIENLKIIKEKVSKEKQRKVKEVQEELDELRGKVAQYNIGLYKIQKHITSRDGFKKEVLLIKNDAKKLKDEKKELDTDIAVARKKIKLFQNMCPECPKVKVIQEDSDIDDKVENSILIADQLQTLKDQFELLQNSIEKANKIISNESFVKNSKKDSLRRITRLEAELAKEHDDDIIIDESKLHTLQKERTDLENNYNSLNKMKRHLIVTKQLLADEGIKSFIIKRYLPHVNKILNTYLQKFNTGILFYFDTEFNEVIGSRYKENSGYYCFSEGQKRRIDMAILFTFLEFCKIKNRKSETNLLIMDEITSGVDVPGENMLYDILRDMVNKEDKEVITISHSGNIDADKIDRLMSVKIDGGYSVLEELEA